MLERLTNLFPLWVLLGAALGLWHPPAVTWFSGPAIVWGLAAIMLGMGITLDVHDFRRVVERPWPVLIGFVAQYTIMPALGWSIAWLLQLEPPLAVGLVLVACCPGGTASNVVTYLARGDVPLSIVMTTVSTLAAVVMTPLLTKVLAGAWVPVDAAGLLLSTAQVVLLPVLGGLALHHGAPRLVRVVLPIAPLVSVAFIALICASILGQNAEAVRSAAGTLLLAVGMLHAGGFFVGWLFARACGQGVTVSRTVAIEVGMQNSGLGVVLARQHFTDPLTAVPCAISATVHSIVGSSCAAVWRRRPPGDG